MNADHLQMIAIRLPMAQAVSIREG